MTGTSFIKNKFNTYLNLAKSKNPAYGGFRDTKKGKEAQEIRGVIEDALLGAKNILILSEFSDESMLGEYNTLVDRINRDNAEYEVRFAERLERSKLRTGEVETVGIDYPLFHFPGMPQRDRENKEKAENYSLKSSILYYGSIVSATLFGLGVVKYYQDYSDYKSLSSVSPALYYLAPELAPVLLASDQSKFKDSFQKLESSAQIVNGGLGIFGMMVLISHIDLLTTSKKVDTLGNNDGLPLYQFEKGQLGLTARPSYMGMGQKPIGTEMQYNMEYRYQF